MSKNQNEQDGKGVYVFILATCITAYLLTLFLQPGCGFVDKIIPPSGNTTTTIDFVGNSITQNNMWYTDENEYVHWRQAYKIDKITLLPTGYALGEKIDIFLKANKNNKCDVQLADSILSFVTSNLKTACDVNDDWQSPYEVIKSGAGDCEDWMSITYFIFDELGFNNYKGAIFYQGIDRHVCLIWYDDIKDKDPYVIDPLQVVCSSLTKLSKADINRKSAHLKFTFDVEGDFVEYNN